VQTFPIRGQRKQEKGNYRERSPIHHQNGFRSDDQGSGSRPVGCEIPCKDAGVPDRRLVIYLVCTGFDSLCRPSPLGDSENKRKGTIVVNDLSFLRFDSSSAKSLHDRLMAGEVKECEWASGLKHGDRLIARIGSVLLSYSPNGVVSTELFATAKMAALMFRARTCRFVYHQDR